MHILLFTHASDEQKYTYQKEKSAHGISNDLFR